MKIAFALTAIVSALAMLLTADVYATTTRSVPAATRVISAQLDAGQDEIPAGSKIEYDYNHKKIVTMPPGGTYEGVPIVGPFGVDYDGTVFTGTPYRIAHDVTVTGVTCSARAPVMYTVGRIGSCTLRSGTTLDGVPCRTDRPASFGGEEIGGRAQCVLAKSWVSHDVRWPAGTEIDLLSNTYTTGSSPPAGLRLAGKAVPAKARIVIWPTYVWFNFENGATYCQAVAATSCRAGDTKLSSQELTIGGQPFIGH